MAIRIAAAAGEHGCVVLPLVSSGPGGAKMILLRHPLGMGGIVTAFLLAWAAPVAGAQAEQASFDPSIRPDFSEPVVLASKDGVLEVRLIAKQGEARLDTVATPVKNMLLFGYELIRGTASNGQMSGDNLYPSPTLQVFPGETLIVHLDNALTGLTIRDFFDPQYTAKGEEVPLYPPMMTSSPLNLHVHGVHVSPKGNADNVMLHIPGGVVEHLHLQYSEDHAARRLLVSQPSAWADDAACLLRHGGAAGDRPHRRQPAARHGEQHPDPQHGAAIQLRVRPGRRQRATQQLYLAAMGQHDQAAGSRRAGEGHLSSAARPGQLPPIEAGHAKFHRLVRGAAVDPQRARAIRVHPEQSAALHRLPGGPGKDVPADPGLPDYSATCSSPSTASSSRSSESKAGQTEIWVLANVSDIAYMHVQLTETATGNHPKIAIVGQDGDPYPDVHYPDVRERHAAAHSAGDALCHRRDDARRRRAHPRDAAPRRRRHDDQRPGRALHQ